MPLYGFECNDCHHHFEVLMPISQLAEDGPKCQHCGSEQTIRKMGNVMAIIGNGTERKVISNSGCNSCSTKSPSACSGCK